VSDPGTPARADDVVRVRVPFAIHKRGGRKLVLAPGAAAAVPDKLLESGVHGTIADIAAAEAINASYVSRILRLTLLAPQIVELILDGRQQPGITLSKIMSPFAIPWHEQASALQVGN